MLTKAEKVELAQILLASVPVDIQRITEEAFMKSLSMEFADTAAFLVFLSDYVDSVEMVKLVEAQAKVFGKKFPECQAEVEKIASELKNRHERGDFVRIKELPSITNELLGILASHTKKKLH